MTEQENTGSEIGQEQLKISSRLPRPSTGEDFTMYEEIARIIGSEEAATAAATAALDRHKMRSEKHEWSKTPSITNFPSNKDSVSRDTNDERKKWSSRLSETSLGTLGKIKALLEKLPDPTSKTIPRLVSWFGGSEHEEQRKSMQRSQATDAYLIDEAQKFKRKRKVLIFGNNQQDVLLWKKMRLVEHPLTQVELADLKVEARKTLREALHALTGEILRRVSYLSRGQEERLLDDIWIHLEEIWFWTEEENPIENADLTILDYQILDNQLRKIGIDFESLQRHVIDQELCFSRDPSSQGSSAFLNNAKRVFSPDYEPDVQDWLHLDKRRSKTIIDETRIKRHDHGWFSFSFMKTREWTPHRRYIHFFQDSYAVIMVADLAVIHDCLFEDPEFPEYHIHHAIQLYGSICHTESFEDAPVLLILANVASFRREIHERPLSALFPEYEGQDNESAITFVANRFAAVNRKRPHSMYRVESLDSVDHRGLLDLLEKTVRKEPLERSRIADALATDAELAMEEFRRWKESR